MTDNAQLDISSLLDNELSASEVEELLEQIKGDKALQQAWGRYHLVGDAIRGEPIQADTFSIAEKVSESLKSEPPILAHPKPQDQSNPKNRPELDGGVHWLKPAVGVALAASVAGAAVMLMPNVALNPGNSGETDTAALSSPPTLSKSDALQVVADNSSTGYQLSSGTRWKNLSQPEVESKLNRYLINHNELASPAGMTGVLPYTSFVSYDSNR